jgi:hypothetical protein
VKDARRWVQLASEVASGLRHSPRPFTVRPYAVSPRGHRLVLCSEKVFGPTLTVELYEKWYTLFLVRPGPALVDEWAVEPVLFPGNEYCDGAPYVDHVPNPEAVLNYAFSKMYLVDDLALELIVGRWVMERAGESE